MVARVDAEAGAVTRAPGRDNLLSVDDERLKRVAAMFGTAYLVLFALAALRSSDNQARL